MYCSRLWASTLLSSRPFFWAASSQLSRSSARTPLSFSRALSFFLTSRSPGRSGPGPPPARRAAPARSCGAGRARRRCRCRSGRRSPPSFSAKSAWLTEPDGSKSSRASPCLRGAEVLILSPSFWRGDVQALLLPGDLLDAGGLFGGQLAGLLVLEDPLDRGLDLVERPGDLGGLFGHLEDRGAPVDLDDAGHAARPRASRSLRSPWGRATSRRKGPSRRRPWPCRPWNASWPARRSPRPPRPASGRSSASARTTALSSRRRAGRSG